MSEFNKIYANADFYYGDEPSTYLRLFLEKAGIDQVMEGEALDLGCGDGRNALYLSRCGYRVTALDLSAVAVANLNKQAKKRQLHVNSSVADVRKFIYDRDRYQLIVANTVFDHIERSDMENLAHIIVAAIKPNGYIYASVFTEDDPGHLNLAQRSDTAKFVKYYFKKGELRQLFQNLTLLRYQEEYFLDTSHGVPHYHGIARLIARRVD